MGKRHIYSKAQINLAEPLKCERGRKRAREQKRGNETQREGKTRKKDTIIVKILFTCENEVHPHMFSGHFCADLFHTEIPK